VIVTRGVLASRQIDGMIAKVREAIAKREGMLSDPSGALAPGNSLRGALSSVHRVSIGRLRIFYLVDRDKTQVRILWVGMRADGDRDDAYTELEDLLRGTALDESFALLGVTKPTV